MSQQPDHDRLPTNGKISHDIPHNRPETNGFPAITEPRIQIEQLLRQDDLAKTMNHDTGAHVKRERDAGRLGERKPSDSEVEQQKNHQTILEKIEPFRDTPVRIHTRDELQNQSQGNEEQSDELKRFNGQTLPQFLMAFNGLEGVLPQLKKRQEELNKKIEEDSRRLRAVEDGVELKREEAVESLLEGINAQMELKGVEEKIALVVRKTEALKRFTSSLLEAIKNPEVCDLLNELLANESAEDLKDLALRFVETPEESLDNAESNQEITEPDRIDDLERKILVSILQEYAQMAGEKKLSDFPDQDLTFHENSGEFAIILRIRLRLGRNDLTEEERESLSKLLRAFLECFKKPDIRARIVSAFKNTPAPALLRLATRIVTDRTSVNTGTYYRLRLEEKEHIPQTVKLGVKSLKELRTKIRENEKISESNRQAILIILFYALQLMKPIAGRIPSDESTKKYRKAVARANRALTPLREIVGAVESLYTKATKAAEAGRNEIIMVPDTVNIQFSLLRAIRDDISFSRINEETVEQTIEGTKLLGIHKSFDLQVLEILKQLFQSVTEHFPEHQAPSNISAEELIGFMLESNHDRSRDVYQQWVLQILTRTASNMFPLNAHQHLKAILAVSDHTPVLVNLQNLKISDEDKKLLQVIQGRLDDIERMSRQPENIKNPSFLLEKAYSFASGIMSIILFISPDERERCHFTKHFNYLIQIIENAARKTDTFFDDSLVKELLGQMTLYSETGKGNGGRDDEPLTEDVADLFKDFDLE